MTDVSNSEANNEFDKAASECLADTAKYKAAMMRIDKEFHTSLIRLVENTVEHADLDPRIGQPVDILTENFLINCTMKKLPVQGR